MNAEVKAEHAGFRKCTGKSNILPAMIFGVWLHIKREMCDLVDVFLLKTEGQCL